MKPKGCRSASRGRSRLGPASPRSAISASISPMISEIILRTERPCWGTSPFTAMCNRQSMGSFNSASRPLTPRPRKKTRAPLSVSIRRWCAPPRPMMRLSTLDPYTPRTSKLSKKIFSDQGYLFSGMAGGGSFGNFGATYGFGGAPGGGGGVIISTGPFGGGFMSRIDVASSSKSPGKITLCSLSSLTIFCTSTLCLAKSMSSKPSTFTIKCSNEDSTPRCSCAGFDFFQSVTRRHTRLMHSKSG
mmetsp:Transcript_105646/g.303823  ORF Transcript_105646/g.303823 Transcript_105646/m.303823 type:complete len:245 (-) Transcript_105646:323-1057(-)